MTSQNFQKIGKLSSKLQDFDWNSEFSLKQTERWTLWTFRENSLLRKESVPLSSNLKVTPGEKESCSPTCLNVRLEKYPGSGWRAEGERVPEQIWGHIFAHSRIMECLTLKKRSMLCCLGFAKTSIYSRGNLEICLNSTYLLFQTNSYRTETSLFPWSISISNAELTVKGKSARCEGRYG